MCWLPTTGRSASRRTFASASTGTASAAEVWGNDRAWLQAVDSPYDQSVSSHWNTNGNSSGTARFSRQTLQDRIRDVMDIDLSGVDPNSWFTIQSANQYGWVAKIQVGPDAGVGTVSGRWFRENLLARQSVDGRSLRSQCFTVSYNADLDCFIFDVYGYGHGCGMSQWGCHRLRPQRLGLSGYSDALFRWDDDHDVLRLRKERVHRKAHALFLPHGRGRACPTTRGVV